MFKVFSAVVLVRVGVLAATAGVIILMLSFGIAGLLAAFAILGAAGFLTEWWARRRAMAVHERAMPAPDGETMLQAVGALTRSFAIDALGLTACVLLFVALAYTATRIAAVVH